MESPLDNLSTTLHMELAEYVSLRSGRLTLIGPIEVWDELMIQDLDLAIDWGIKEIELLISSPGGDVISGIRAIRAILRARQHGVRITGTVRGEAASMAFLVLQACDERRMGEGDILMTHGITSGMVGDMKAIESHQKLLGYWRAYFAKMLATRVQKTEGHQGGVAATEGYWEAILKDETPLYYTPYEALGLGLVDMVEEFNV